MIKIDNSELSIYEVENLHKDLLKELESGEMIIDLANVNKIDMSVIQLFISAKKSALESSISFAITNVNEELSNIFKSAGCLSLLGEKNV